MSQRSLHSLAQKHLTTFIIAWLGHELSPSYQKRSAQAFDYIRSFKIALHYFTLAFWKSRGELLL
jgi:hypothetical protein